MIAIILLIALVLYAGLFAKMDFRKGRFVVILVAFIVIAGTVFLMSENDQHHFGMKKITTQQTLKLAPSVAKNDTDILLFKQLGTTQKEAERVYLYKTTTKQKSYTQTPLDNATLALTQDSKQPVLKKIKTQYQFKNTFYKLLLLGSGDKRTTHTKYVFEVPSSWLVLNTTQAKKLPALVKKYEAQGKLEVEQMVKSAAPALIAQKMQAAIAKDPTLLENQAQLQATTTQEVVKQLTAQFTKEVSAKTKLAIQKDLAKKP